MGCIYRRPDSKYWWVKYFRVGKAYSESSHSEKENDAKKLLRLREGQVVENKLPSLRAQKVTLDELSQDLINDYKVNRQRTLSDAEDKVKNLKDFFGNIRAMNITTDKIRLFILHRQEQGRANATINRDLAALKRMFNLARQMTPPKVVSVPYIPHLTEDNARQGFFEGHEYRALLDSLPAYLKPVLMLGYYTGMRREEILGLQWEQVDLMAGVIRLRPQDTKTKEGRIIYMRKEILDIISYQHILHTQKFLGCPLVFPSEMGEKIVDFRKAWKTACKAAGLEGKIFHDLRRTAVRNMIRAGIPERVAMQISGHKTRAVFDRYNIVSEEDLKKAADKMAEYYRDASNKEGKGKAADGYVLVTVDEKDKEMEPVGNA